VSIQPQACGLQKFALEILGLGSELRSCGAVPFHFIFDYPLWKTDTEDNRVNKENE